MKEKLQSFIRKQRLFAPTEKVLLAVSGGIDSVVMCHLFKALGFQFGIAHCNFKLRAEASDQDEVFVKALAAKLEVPFFNVSFKTKERALEAKSSIQIVARALRYEWLDKVCKEEGYQFIATAHHLNDSIETFIYNFAKGTGIKGLQGIPLKQGKIIRPLLSFSKLEIEQFAEANEISYRSDASNEEDKYARNKIRHHIVPRLKELNPSLEKTAQKSFSNINEAYDLYQFAIQSFKSKIVQEEGNQSFIEKKALRDGIAIQTILFEILNPYGFNSDQITQILEGEFENIGAKYYSSDYFLLVDREYLILAPNNEAHSAIEEVLIDWGIEEMKLDESRLTVKKIETTIHDFNCPNTVALLNLDQTHFPLKARKWHSGDFFHPLGMEGKRKKLQDFYTDQKLSRIEKESTWVLTTAKNEICWVIPYRIDERFKLTKESKSHFRLELIVPQ